MPIYFFNWSAETVEHLADNDVFPEEFEMVVQEDFARLSQFFVVTIVPNCVFARQVFSRQKTVETTVATLFGIELTRIRLTDLPTLDAYCFVFSTGSKKISTLNR